MSHRPMSEFINLILKSNDLRFLVVHHVRHLVDRIDVSLLLVRVLVDQLVQLLDFILQRADRNVLQVVIFCGEPFTFKLCVLSLDQLKRFHFDAVEQPYAVFYHGHLFDIDVLVVIVVLLKVDGIPPSNFQILYELFVFVVLFKIWEKHLDVFIELPDLIRLNILSVELMVQKLSVGFDHLLLLDDDSVLLDHILSHPFAFTFHRFQVLHQVLELQIHLLVIRFDRIDQRIDVLKELKLVAPPQLGEENASVLTLDEYLSGELVQGYLEHAKLIITLRELREVLETVSRTFKYLPAVLVDEDAQGLGDKVGSFQSQLICVASL